LTIEKLYNREEITPEIAQFFSEVSQIRTGKPRKVNSILFVARVLRSSF
jgi:hypothetical protein